MKAYRVVMEAGLDVYTVIVPAKDEEQARERVCGNGDVIQIKDVTDELRVSENAVANALVAGGFDQHQIDLICRMLSFEYHGCDE